MLATKSVETKLETDLSRLNDKVSQQALKALTESMNRRTDLSLSM